MFDHYPRIELPITIDEFHRLPRNAGYKYEYFDRTAVLSPRPKSFSCVRDLSPVAVAEPHRVERLPTNEILDLVQLFAHANAFTQPWQSLDAAARLAVSRDCLQKVLDGGDGPLAAAACVRVFDDRDGAVGAALVTLVHPSVLTEPFGGEWPDDGPPVDAMGNRLGVPHLTWVFVHPWLTRRGYGKSLLAAVVERLRVEGFSELASTFALDNGPSALWHWRHGFRLLPQMSVMGERWRNKGERGRRPPDTAGRS